MRKYEVMLLFQPSLGDELLQKEIIEAENLLGGTIVEKNEWGLKKLAYPIKKFSEAYYIVYYVETNPENIIAFKGMLTIKKEIIRNMIIKHEKKWPFEMKTTKDIVFQSRKNQTMRRQEENIVENLENAEEKVIAQNDQ